RRPRPLLPIPARAAARSSLFSLPSPSLSYCFRISVRSLKPPNPPPGPPRPPRGPPNPPKPPGGWAKAITAAPPVTTPASHQRFVMLHSCYSQSRKERVNVCIGILGLDINLV